LPCKRAYRGSYVTSIKPYGIEKNRQNIEALCQYSFEQGLSARKMALEELFAPETFDEFKI
jgi:4,5-dihydroxyphthalate decarboxylase